MWTPQLDRSIPRGQWTARRGSRNRVKTARRRSEPNCRPAHLKLETRKTTIGKNWTGLELNERRQSPASAVYIACIERGLRKNREPPHLYDPDPLEFELIESSPQGTF